jgi:hypothetical protein
MFTAGVRVACMGRLICAFAGNVKAQRGLGGRADDRRRRNCAALTG